MKRIITTTLTAATTVLAGIAVTTPATAQPSTPTGTKGSTVSTRSVVVGKLDGLAGNRHQLKLDTRDGHVGSVTSSLTSYYCPSGASISPTWVSSKCTLRSTYTLTSFAQDNEISLLGRISASGRSATQKGPVFGVSNSSDKTFLLNSNLSLYSHEGDPTSLSGTFGGRSLQTTGRTATFSTIGNR